MKPYSILWIQKNPGFFFHFFDLLTIPPHRRMAQTCQTSHLVPHLDPSGPGPDLKKCAKTPLDTQYGPPRSIFDPPGLRIFFRFLTKKVDFLTAQTHRPFSSQISQLGTHLGTSRPVPDLKMHRPFNPSVTEPYSSQISQSGPTWARPDSVDRFRTSL